MVNKYRIFNKNLNVKIRMSPEFKKGSILKFEMSRNAAIGFSEHCKYQSKLQSGKNNNHWHIDPLGYIPGYRNQVFGFYLTSLSPSLIIGFEKDSIQNECIEKMNIEIEDINIVEMQYEKELDNIINIVAINDENIEYVLSDSTLELMFTRHDLIVFSEELDKLVTNFDRKVSNEIFINDSNNHWSIKMTIKDLGIITDYDSTL